MREWLSELPEEIPGWLEAVLVVLALALGLAATYLIGISLTV
jgi:hypothetical protein